MRVYSVSTYSLPLFSGFTFPHFAALCMLFNSLSLTFCILLITRSIPRRFDCFILFVWRDALICALYYVQRHCVLAGGTTVTTSQQAYIARRAAV